MDNRRPFVSIIVLNLNGKKIIPYCLDSLKKINYPKNNFEVVVVDNGSKDDSAYFIKKQYPEVVIIENEKNLGFCVANNRAVEKAKGEYVIFLNNDMRVEADWLNVLVDKITSNDKIATASSKILSWDGKKINYGGADSDVFMNARMEGYLDENKKTAYKEDKEILFPSGGSMIIKKDLFLNAGGFDEDFFAYYEDVDLGVRLKVLGYENHFVHNAIVYHMHSATSKKMPKEKLRVLQMRNTLWIILKNYSDANVNKFFTPALLLLLQRTFEIAGNFYPKKYDFLRIESSKAKMFPVEIMLKNELMLLSDMLGYSDILKNWKKLMEKRMQIQKQRKNSDEEIFKLMKSKYVPIVESKEYMEAYNNFLNFFKIKTI